jgi:hypothetical protein
MEQQMTTYYQIEFSNKENGWIPKKQGSDYNYRRVPKSPPCDTIEEAELWIAKNHIPRDRFDRPWIDHKIESFSGHLMTLEEWKQDCDDGGFTDYDGYGNAVDHEYKIIEISDSSDYEGNHIWPSDYTKRGGNKIPTNTKYILWYNH